MISRSTLAALFVASAFLTAGAAPPASASPGNDAFVANARANVDFLDSASRLALSHSSDPRLRAFAHREAMDQTITGNSLVAYRTANDGPASRPSNGPFEPVASLAALPLSVAANVTNGVATNVDNVMTGRSVATDNPLSVPVGPSQPRLNAGLDDLDRLSAMRGRDFDALYRSTQRDALRQLATLYRDYLQNGDNDALRAIARRALPKINRDLMELNSI